MPAPVVRFETPATLVGGGVLDASMLAEARALAPGVLAADGAADRLRDLVIQPDAVIGDMDSISDLEHWRAAGVTVLHLTEQETTDFEKCLYASEAPFYIAVGFTGGRLDHSLAVLHVMLARPERTVILLGDADVSALVPPGRALRLELEPGERVSLFPLLSVPAGRSEGLRWPIDALTMTPGRQSGTSNQAAGSEVLIQYDDPGMLLTLERKRLSALIGAITGDG